MHILCVFYSPCTPEAAEAVPKGGAQRRSSEAGFRGGLQRRSSEEVSRGGPLFFRTPQTDNAKRSQSSIIRVQLIRAPISIKTLLQNGTKEVWSHSLMFPHPEDDVSRLVVSISLIESVFVHSDIVS